MAAFDMTAASAVLKTLYPQKEITKALYKNNPLLGLMPKRTDFYGANIQLAVRYGLTAGRSHTFTTAQGNKAGSRIAKFLVTDVFDYSLASITGQTIRATKNDKGALTQALENETDAALWALKRSLAIDMYRSGTGSRGQISSGSNVGTTTITLSAIQDITQFEVGQWVVFSATDGGALRNAGTAAQITGVDRMQGTLTFGSNLNAIVSAVAAGDFIYQQGDAANGGSNLALSGLLAWVPTTAPSGGDSFFGLNRSADATRLGGIRYVGTGNPIEETLVTAIAYAAREGADITHVMMNNADYLNLVLALGSKVIYDEDHASDVPEVGYTAVKIAAPGASGFAKVFADPNCPKGRAFGLQMDTWCLWTREEIGFLMDDDQRILREATSDSYELRMGYYGQVVCDAPGNNINISL